MTDKIAPTANTTDNSDNDIKKVLVIDDNIAHILPLLNGLKRRALRQNWCYYYPEQNNVTAIISDIEANLNFSPDVVILDIMMPLKKGGDELYHGGLNILEKITTGEFAQIPITTPIIILSGAEDLDRIEKKYGDKIYRCISKPADPQTIFTAIMAVK